VKSIELKEKQGNLRGLAVGYHNIGAIKNDMLDYHGAIKEFEKSNVLAKQVDYKLLIAYNALKTGSSYENLKEHEKAIENFKVGQSIAEEISFKKGTNAAHLGLGLNYTSLNKPVEAIFNLSKALQLAEEIGDKSEECSALIGIADWYNAFEGNLGGEEMIYYQNEIEDILLRAKDLSEEMNYGEKRLSVYNSLERYYEKRNDYKKHASILSEMQIYKDTLFSKTRAEAIAGWETKYATAEKEKEIIQLQADKEISELKATSWKIALGLTTLFLAILGYFLYKYQQRKNAQKQLEEAEKFRSKLSSDLHDDVGTMLSSLAMQSEVMGLTAKDEQVEKFEKLSNLSREAMSRMRDTVWAIDARKDKVDDLLDRMKDYVSDRLEGHPLQVSFDHKEVLKESKLRPDVRQNIYLIFKEAVHNAAKYSNGDKLNIIFKQNEKDLYLEVRDNGTIDEDKIKTSGLGTSNMKMRAERIGKTLEIHTKKGFAVIVK
jgi:signal transduction histidine kinase